jgi:hypothetical protein
MARLRHSEITRFDGAHPRDASHGPASLGRFGPVLGRSPLRTYSCGIEVTSTNAAGIAQRADGKQRPAKQMTHTSQRAGKAVNERPWRTMDLGVTAA